MCAVADFFVSCFFPLLRRTIKHLCVLQRKYVKAIETLWREHIHTQTHTQQPNTSSSSYIVNEEIKANVVVWCILFNVCMHVHFFLSRPFFGVSVGIEDVNMNFVRV